MIRRTAVEGNSLLHRLNPTVKLAVAFYGSFVLIFVLDPVTPAIYYGLVLAAMLVLARLSPRIIGVAHLPFLPFAFSIFWVNVLFRQHGQVGLSLGPLTFTDEGLRIGASLALRTLVIGAYAATFVLTTDPSRLVTSLVQDARLSPRFAYAMLAAYRLLPALEREWVMVGRAHAMRGEPRGGGPLRRIRRLARQSLPLLVAAARRAERVGIALEARALGVSPQRTVWRPTPLRRSDIAFLLAALALLTVVPAVTASLGLFRGPEALTVF